ncbi:MAG: helix-hairpin-helix domain-containing protein [Gaiella sp.]|nr:helix-hairpin-helix domain-containing protein [Gaiella sp.]
MPPLPRNADVADTLEELADVSEILGEQGFRVLAYRRAATRVRETGASIAELALQGTAKELPGIGATIESKIAELAETGSMAALAKRRAEVPVEVRQFLRLPGLGPKTAARIWRELGVTTLEELRIAAEQQRVRTLQGLGAKSEERILEALAKGFGPEPERRGLLGVGLPVVRQVVEELRAHPAAVEVSGAGSIRRGRETFRDLDVIATATDPPSLIARFVTLPWVLEVAARGDTKATVVTKQGLRLDLRVVPPEDFGSLLQHFTGSKDHNVALREEAQRRGLSVSEYGVTIVETGEVHRFAREDELYRFLGYQPIPPELRENAGELEAARHGGLPELVEVTDLVGELHCHSSWSSDGKASIEEMARTARSLGYRFLALTDHSHYLREGRMEAQWDEIDGVNERVKPFRVLRGSRRTFARTAPSTSPTNCSRSWTGSSRRSTIPSSATRPSGFSPRSTTHTSTASATSPGASSTVARAPRSTSSASSPGRRRPVPSSRSTASRTGSTCETCTRGSRARPACPSQ